MQFIQNSTNTVIQFDASIEENHTRESPPTEFPVESGAVISDHIIVKPFQLEMTGIISDTPIGGVSGLIQEAASSVAGNLIPPIGVVAAAGAAALFSALADSKSPSVAAYAQLLQLQAGIASPVTGQVSGPMPFDVLTSLYRYPSMWIKSLSVPRNAETGKILLFKVSLVQLLIVQPQSVNISIFANPGLAAGLADTGQQSEGIPSGFKQGLSDSTAGIKQVLPNGISGGTQ